jgi:hypothetical protein
MTSNLLSELKLISLFINELLLIYDEDDIDYDIVALTNNPNWSVVLPKSPNVISLSSLCYL